jgi:hypothetical protein
MSTIYLVFLQVGHYYHVDLSNAIIDYNLNELCSRFSEQTTELI